MSSGEKPLAMVIEDEPEQRNIFTKAIEMADFSGIKAFLDNLRAQGVQDLQTYFEEHREELIKCHLTIDDTYEISVTNKEVMRLYKAESLVQMLEELYTTVFTEDSFRGLIELFVAFANGTTRFSRKIVDSDFKGDEIAVMITWVIVPGYEDTWRRVIYSVVPYPTECV